MILRQLARQRGEGGEVTTSPRLPRRAVALTRALFLEAIGEQASLGSAFHALPSDACSQDLDLDEARRWFATQDLSATSPEVYATACADLAMLSPRISPGGEVEAIEEGTRRKELGVFFTPPAVAQWMARSALEPLIEGASAAQLRAITILDPACGGGALLLAGWRVLLDAYRARGVHPSRSERLAMMSHHLHGADLSPDLVEIAREALLMEVWRDGGEASGFDEGREDGEARALFPNVVCEDGLGLSEESPGPDTPETHHACVLANPPYSLAQQMEDAEQFMARARARFVSATYKVDTYLLFFERCMNLLGEDGRAAILTPRSWLKNHHARLLREALLTEHTIETLCLLDFNVFPSASVEPIITLARHGAANQSHHAAITRWSEQGGASELEELASVAQSSWRSAPECAISLHDGDVRDQLEAHTTHTTPLKSLATVYFGLQTMRRATWVKAAPPDDGREWFPCIDGKQIERFATKPPAEFVCADPIAIKSGGLATVHEQDRIGVRQIGNHPIAARVDGGTWALNTLYNISITDDARALGYELDYLLGVILSSPTRWYWEHALSDHKRVFPKVKKRELCAIPIPTIDFLDATQRDAHRAIADLTAALRDLREQSWQKMSEDEARRIEDAISRKEEALDEHVERLLRGTSS